MNTLGKTVVSIGICIVIIAALFFTRDFGAPSGKHGRGFGTESEALEDSIGASYSIDSEIGKIEYDDGVIYICKTKDNHIMLSYLFRNRQKTKYYYSGTYYVYDAESIKETEWHDSQNKVKTNFKIADASASITECDNLPVNVKEYSVMLNKTEVKFKLYYNRVEK